MGRFLLGLAFGLWLARRARANVRSARGAAGVKPPAVTSRYRDRRTHKFVTRLWAMFNPNATEPVPPQPDAPDERPAQPDEAL